MVDSSVWIDYLYHNQHSDICDYLDRYLEGEKPIFCTPIILQEVLQGIKKDSDFKRIRQNFLAYQFFQFDNQLQAAQDAASIFRACRKKGFTIRKAYDCLIALTCLHFDLELLHIDKDFDHIASLYPLKIVSV